MLIAKGSRVSFDLMDGSHVGAPASYGMLHDPSGEDWPKNSVLITGYKKGRVLAEKPSNEAKNYFGRGYEVKAGSVNTPEKALSSWKKIGEVKTIYYSRPGTKAPGGYFHHFVKGAAIEYKVFRGGGHHPVLSRKGRTLRLELQKGATLNERGFVWP